MLQFVGFMAGWNQPGSLAPPAAATIAALLASWATFLPSFIFILVGAPYGEKLSCNVRLSTALACITAAVVGVIGSLAIAFGRNVLFPAGLAPPTGPRSESPPPHSPCCNGHGWMPSGSSSGGAAAGLALGLRLKQPSC